MAKIKSTTLMAHAHRTSARAGVFKTEQEAFRAADFGDDYVSSKPGQRP